MEMVDLQASTALVTQAQRYITKLPTALVVIAAGWLAIRYFKALLRRIFKRSGLEPTLAQLILGLTSFIGWTVVLAGIFSILGFDQIALAFSGSVAVLALGVAQGLKGVVNDLLAGLFLIADSDFRVGKRIQVGGVEGEIICLDIRKTKIRDDLGSIHVMPNRNIDNSTYVVRPGSNGDAV